MDLGPPDHISELERSQSEKVSPFYDLYGNRTFVSASGYSASNQNVKGTELAKAGSAQPGSANILPATSTLSVPPALATESTAAIAQPSDPKVSLPTEQLAARTDIKLPDSLRTDAPRSTANSHHASRSALAKTAPPQGSPPVFTDPNLLASGVLIRTLHITELRIAINDLRLQRGYSTFSWQTSATGLIKADPIIEMRAALDGALGQPSPAYSAFLAQGQPILAIHIQELRNRVVANWNSSVQIPSDGHANLSYDSTSNRITTAGFSYDAAGNQVRALIAGSASQRFQYDAANRLVNVKTDNNQTVIANYTYGDSNERLVVQEGSLRTYYACGGKAEYVESGGSTTPQWSKSYIYLGARLLSTLTPNGSGGEFVQYHHPDRLGTRLVTNAQDTTYFEQQTLPFGTALNESPPTGGTTGATNRRFTTYDRNLNTGLDYAVNRHYDPQQGHFTQVDPIGMSSVSLESPQTLNLYAYCINDPINHTDPSGLGFFSFLKKLVKWTMVVVAVALIVAATVLSGNPFVSAALIKTAYIMGGLLLGTALGPSWLKRAISIGVAAAGIYIQRPAGIWNIAAPTSSSNLGKWLTLAAAGGQWIRSKRDRALAKKREAARKERERPHRLSPCVQKLLGPWFKELVLSRIITHNYKPWYVRGDAEGYTEGPDIYFRDGIDQQSIGGIKLIGHEITHIRQELRYPFSYAARYGAAASREIVNGRDPAGMGNPFEKEAYDMGDAIETDLNKQFRGRNPCP